MSDDSRRPDEPGHIARFVNGVTLGRWPLLTLGLATIVLGVYLADEADPEGTRAFVLAVGAVLVGAGVVLVAWNHHDPTRRDPRLRTRSADRRRVSSEPTE